MNLQIHEEKNLFAPYRKITPEGRQKRQKPQNIVEIDTQDIELNTEKKQKRLLED